MIGALMISSIPACIYTEYSHKAIGFKRPVVGALVTFVLLNSSILLLTNLDYNYLPSFYNYIFGLLIFSAFYFTKDDSCSCER